ncbi:MAG TPA: spermidine/putrescine ABC transporter substrate-binding protein [Victivallales bacterium]|nr:spermidine/putrescine ABC transporter substrate-binding protein [Victivallales bacterium]
MKKIISFVLLLIAILSLTSCSDGKRTLYIYNWSDYIAPDLLTKFQNKYNCNVVIDYFDSNEAMYAKIEVSNSGYDIIFPSSYMADIMRRQHLIRKLDKSKIPNIKYVDRIYTDKTADPNMNYSVPYMISLSGIAYDKRVVKNIKPTWGVFGDKKYAGRMTMFDDMREAIGAALKYLGYSYNSTNDAQLEQAKELMLKWKKNLAAYQVDEAKTSLGAGILLVIQAYNGDIYQMLPDSPQLGFVYPEEGTSIGLDTMVIPSDSKNTDLAYKFINFMYEPKNSIDNMKYVFYLCPNRKAMKMLDKNFLSEITLPKELFKKSEVIHNLGRYNEKYVKIWDEIKIE